MLVLLNVISCVRNPKSHPRRDLKLYFEKFPVESTSKLTLNELVVDMNVEKLLEMSKVISLNGFTNSEFTFCTKVPCV